MYKIITTEGNGYSKGRNGYFKPFGVGVDAGNGTDHVRLTVNGSKGVDNAILSLPVKYWPAIIRALQAAVKAAKAQK